MRNNGPELMAGARAMAKTPATMEHTVSSRRLQFSLIPTPLWGRNLRSIMGRSRWRKLREELLAGRDLICDVCGTDVGDVSELKGHEQWRYSEKKRTSSIAKLIGMSFVCELCHDAEHFGRIQKLRIDGQLTDDRVKQIVRHYCRVNDVSRMQFDEDLALAHEEHLRRSQLKWLVDWGAYRGRVEQTESARERKAHR